jgi:hypothetical protein
MLSVSRLHNVGDRVINKCGAAGVMRNGRGTEVRESEMLKKHMEVKQILQERNSFFYFRK